MDNGGSLKNLRIGKRDINLSDEDESLLISSLNVLSGVSVSRDQLYSVFNDWKMARTIAMRRLVLSVSMLVIGGWFIGVDASKVSFIGLSLQNGDARRFYILIAFFLIVVSLLFFIFLYIDKALRVARVKEVEEMIGICGGSFDNVKEISGRYEVPPQVLVVDFVGDNDNVKKELLSSLMALGFYREYLERPKVWNSCIDVCEVVVVSVLFMLALLIISCSIF